MKQPCRLVCDYMSTILVKNGLIVTMQGEGVHVIEDGALAIEEDKIVAVGPTNNVTRDYSNAEFTRIW